MHQEEDEYGDEAFEEEDEVPPPVCWKTIKFDEISLGERLGGGSVGLVHRGQYKGENVAVKTLVSLHVRFKHLDYNAKLVQTYSKKTPVPIACCRCCIVMLY